MEHAQLQNESRQKQIERAVRQTTKAVDELVLPYLPSLVRGQVGAALIKLLEDVSRTFDEA
ncbi:hypothetical protein [Spirosoma pollinicola]|nr:hypothetical protein [Spirosoma pollinicola]